MVCGSLNFSILGKSCDWLFYSKMCSIFNKSVYSGIFGPVRTHYEFSVFACFRKQGLRLLFKLSISLMVSLLSCPRLNIVKYSISSNEIESTYDIRGRITSKKS